MLRVGRGRVAEKEGIVENSGVCGERVRGGQHRCRQHSYRREMAGGRVGGAALLAGSASQRTLTRFNNLIQSFLFLALWPGLKHFPLALRCSQSFQLI